MNVLLVFFALPIAVIILSAILESFINCPFKVAGIFFAIFIVVAFSLGGTAELIVTAIIYTLISFITAVITRFVINRRCCCRNNTESNCNCFSNNCNSCNSVASNNSLNLNDYNLLSNLNALNRIGNSFNEENSAITTNDNINTNNSGNICRRFR